MSTASVVLSGDPNLGPNMAMGAAFGPGNELMVFARNKDPNKTPGNHSGPILLHAVHLSSGLSGSVMRKLVNESAGIFFNMQKEADTTNVVDNGQLVQFSLQYRSVLRDCQEELDRRVEGEEDDQDDTESLIQLSELMYKLELIWNLVEILLVEKNAIGILLPQLLQWISLHFPQADEQTKSILSENADNPESHSQFWETVILYILQGRNDQAQKLLRLHSDFNNEAFVSMDELLRKMPLYNSSMSVVDFEFRWKHWQREVSSRLAEGEFAANKDLTLIASLLSGHDDAFAQIQPLCETWYQWMTGKLLFTKPDAKSYELPHYAEQAINRFGGLTKMTSLDSVLLAAIEGDIAQVMHELCTTLDNFWFPAHLLDLLHHAKQLDHLGHHSSANDASRLRQDGHDGAAGQVGPGLREFLLLEYGQCLMSHKSLWQLGALYLDYCPTQGRHRLELLLARVPLTTTHKAEKILALASKRGMTDLVLSTCKIMGMRALREERRVGTAMAWAIRSQDVSFTTFLADRLLSEYCESGSFSSEDLLDHLGASMILSDRLTFLAKYREFHKLCQQGEFRGAANLLHSLMWSRLAPKYFWVTLLIDALPFLGGACNIAAEEADSEPVMFSSEQTYELMHCLQELTKDTTLPKRQSVLLQEHEAQIRMAMARNLASALMSEGDGGREA